MPTLVLIVVDLDGSGRGVFTIRFKAPQLLSHAFLTCARLAWSWVHCSCCSILSDPIPVACLYPYTCSRPLKALLQIQTDAMVAHALPTCSRSCPPCLAPRTQLGESLNSLSRKPGLVPSLAQLWEGLLSPRLGAHRCPYQVTPLSAPLLSFPLLLAAWDG